MGSPNLYLKLKEILGSEHFQLCYLPQTSRVQLTRKKKKNGIWGAHWQMTLMSKITALLCDDLEG